jgi:hypothetical protein
MGKIIRWKVALMCLLVCSWVGCVTVPPSSTSPSDPPDPFVKAILKEAPASKRPGVTVVSPDVVLKEVPLKTPLAQARAIMEQHGFSCWKGTPEGLGTCLHCTAYRRKNEYASQKIVVKLIYENDRVTGALVTVADTIAR